MTMFEEKRPQQQEKPEDYQKKPFFGVTIGHPLKQDMALDPHADGVDDMSRSGKKVSWAEYDKEMGMACHALPTLTLNGQTIILTRDDLEWLLVQGKSILDGMDIFAKGADSTWAKFRRQVRGEVGNKKIGESPE